MKWLNEEAIDILVNYYYPRAKWLQLNCNWGKLPYEGPDADREVNDPLMQQIDIYDCYTRIPFPLKKVQNKILLIPPNFYI